MSALFSAERLALACNNPQNVLCLVAIVQFPVRGARVGSPYLKRQPGLDLILQNIRNGSIKVGEDLHGQLRVDAVALDEIIQSVCQGSADAVHSAERNAC